MTTDAQRAVRRELLAIAIGVVIGLVLYIELHMLVGYLRWPIAIIGGLVVWTKLLAWFHTGEYSYDGQGNALYLTDEGLFRRDQVERRVRAGTERDVDCN